MTPNETRNMFAAHAMPIAAQIQKDFGHEPNLEEISNCAYELADEMMKHARVQFRHKGQPYSIEKMDGILYYIIPAIDAKVGDEAKLHGWWHRIENLELFLISDLAKNKIRRKVNV